MTYIEKLISKERFLEDLLLREKHPAKIEELRSDLMKLRIKIQKEKWKESV